MRTRSGRLRTATATVFATTLGLLAALVWHAPAAGAYELRVSASPSRAAPTPLAGATLIGTRYVFVAEVAGITQVRFWLDDPARTGPPRQVERIAPWDFAGTAADRSAFGWNTDLVAAGSHTITAEVTSSSGVSTLSATFTIVRSAEPDQIHVSWTGDPATTLTVLWRSRSTATASRLQYRPAGTTTWVDATGSIRPSGTAGALHEVRLTGLQSGTLYDYRVAGDGGVWSQVQQARTAPPRLGHPSFDAVYFADTGLVGRTDGLATGTSQVVNEIRALNPLFVMPGGDYAYFDTDKRHGSLEASIDAWFNQEQAVLSRAATMPTYGNHEVLLGEGYAPWAARFATPEGWNGRRNYSFDIGDTHFVSILAVEETAGLPQASLDWIDADLTAARAAGARWIVPYMHVPAFSDGTNHASNVALRGQLGPLFERHGVKVALTSHDQNYERTFPLVGVPSTMTVTSRSLSCYHPTDGVTWLKVSPAGKLSNINKTFSGWRTTPPPWYTAVRDRTMHHVARLRVTSSALAVEIWGVAGDGSPRVLQDAFQYRAIADCPTPPPPPGDMLVSTSSTRASPIALEGASLSGSRYIFVPAATGITRVTFWLDDTQRLRTPFKVENIAPWDFNGTVWETGAAIPWNTASVSNGSHTITAEIARSDGSRSVVHDPFQVQNPPPP